MSAATTGTALEQQIFYADNDSNIEQVVHRLCILLPRAILLAGFDENGKLLQATFNSYENSHPEWITDFFEHRFLTNPLLHGNKNDADIFIAASKYLLVPGTLYNNETAEKWLKKIEFIESGELISTYCLQEDNIYYMYAWPAEIKKLISKYFSRASALPLAACQFGKTNTTGHLLQCCIAGMQAYATLYSNDALQWHRVFNFNNIEDIAYTIKHLCRQLNITEDSLQIACTATGANEAAIINELAQYLPNIALKNKDANGGYTLPLLEQLYTCA